MIVLVCDRRFFYEEENHGESFSEELRRGISIELALLYNPWQLVDRCVIFEWRGITFTQITLYFVMEFPLVSGVMLNELMKLRVN